MKLLGLVVVLLLAIAVGVDLWVKNVAERRAAEQIQASMDLDVEVDVDFSGFPFIPKALSGDLGDVSVTAAEARVKGVSLDEVTLELHDVEITLSKILAGDQDAVRIGGGDGTAVISEDSLQRALEDEGATADFDLRSGGEVEIDDPRLPQPVTGTISLDGRTLHVTGPMPEATYSIQLPRVMRGLSYEDVRVTDRDLQVGFGLTAGILRAR